MKKTIVVLSFVSLFSLPAFAKFIAQPSPSTHVQQTSDYMKTTVAEALHLPDDSRVMLEGNIVSHIRKDKYQFRDKTGEITLEIDHDRWRGVDVTPQDKVQVKGKIEVKHHGIEVDVKSLNKL